MSNPANASQQPTNPTPHIPYLTSHISYPISYILFVLIAIIILAAWLRLYQLPLLPPGLNFDEAGNGVAALDILKGTPRLWWRIGGGKEPLWPYMIALSTLLLGNIPLALRLPATLVGILTVAASYPLLRVLFPGRRGQILGLLTALGLAVSSWHLHFSRLGFRAILLPLLSTLVFYFLWRGLGRWQSAQPLAWSHRRGPASFDLILSALFMALAMYAYLAGRLLPVAPLLFFGLHSLTNRRRQRPQQNDQPGLSWSFLLKYLLGPLLILLLPLIIYFLFNPADLTARAGAVSIFDPVWNQGDLIGTAWHTLTVTLGTFIGLSGDPNPLVNLPGQPAIPFLLAPFFLIGVLVSLYYAVRPRSATAAGQAFSPYRLLLCWWAVMLLPALLAPEGAPHHLRLIGALVPSFAFIALGLTTASEVLINRLIPASDIPHPTSHIPYLISHILPILIYLLVASQTYSHTFSRWPAAVDFTLPFDLYAVRLAGDIAHAGPDVAYVLPMDIRAGVEARHYTLDYLLAHRRPAPYTYLPVEARKAETLLTKAAGDKTELRVVRWTADKHHEADAKEIVTYLLMTQADLIERESFPVYDVETYALPPAGSSDCVSESPQATDCEPNAPLVFRLPAIDRPIDAIFDNVLHLDAAYVEPAAVAGGWLPVALTLTPLAPMPVDYKASIRLLSPTGERLAQKDRTLLHDYHQGASLWPPEPVNEYYLLPLPLETPAGEYTVTVVIYHPESLAPLVANGGVDVAVGRVRIEPGQ